MGESVCFVGSAFKGEVSAGVDRVHDTVVMMWTSPWSILICLFALVVWTGPKLC